MVKDLRRWAKNRFSSIKRGAPQQAQHSAQVKRDTRASYVTELQVQVRSLQQQITDLTADVESGAASTNIRADRDRLVVLEQQLSETQQELARYQGRI
jgi:hypothetical protein